MITPIIARRNVRPQGEACAGKLCGRRDVIGVVPFAVLTDVPSFPCPYRTDAVVWSAYAGPETSERVNICPPYTSGPIMHACRSAHGVPRTGPCTGQCDGGWDAGADR